MEKSQPFVIPAGVTFQVGDAGLIIENAGDVVLHTTFGRPLARVVSLEGDVVLHGAVTAGALSAGGSVRVNGALTADSVQAVGAIAVSGDATVGTARSGGDMVVGGALAAESLDLGGGLTAGGDVKAADFKAGNDVSVRGSLSARRGTFTGSASVTGGLSSDMLSVVGLVSVGGAVTVGTVRAGDIAFTGETVTARGLQARNSIHIGPGRVQIDAMIASEVRVDARTSGRSTIIESQNDLGTNAVKGGFRLADYAEMFGDPAPYLADRGLTAPGDAWPVQAAASAPPAAPQPSAAPQPAAAPQPSLPPVPQFSPVVAAAVVRVEAAAAAPATPVPIDEPVTVEAVAAESDEDEPAELEGEPELIEVEPTPVPTVHPLHDELVESVEKIVERYADAELPPAVEHLRALIARQGYDEVRSEITTIWSDLVKFHQKRGLRIQHQVTTTFNAINALVKKM